MYKHGWPLRLTFPNITGNLRPLSASAKTKERLAGPGRAHVDTAQGGVCVAPHSQGAYKAEVHGVPMQPLDRRDHRTLAWQSQSRTRSPPSLTAIAPTQGCPLLQRSGGVIGRVPDRLLTTLHLATLPGGGRVAHDCRPTGWMIAPSHGLSLRLPPLTPEPGPDFRVALGSSCGQRAYMHVVKGRPSTCYQAGRFFPPRRLEFDEPTLVLISGPPIVPPRSL